ncbi:hypothetical protein FRC11_004458, partial [Ceratobasidium sp. 423]
MISERALAESWERYWAYAPHVKALNMYGFGSTFDNVSMTLHVRGWDILFAKRRQFEGPLLPNLEKLNTKQWPRAFDPTNQLALFALFLSPSIKKLELLNYSISGLNAPEPEFPSPSSLLLVNNLAQSFPVSRSVTLPPYYDCPTEHMVTPLSLGAREEFLSWFQRFSPLTNLTHLEIYTCTISGGSGEGLIVLGHLPHLERLEILGTPGSNRQTQSFFQAEPLPIPSGLFPRLQSLRLKNIPSTQLFYHIWNSETMVSKLTDVMLYFNFVHCLITRDELESRIVPLLGSSSPNLRSAGFFVRINLHGPDDGWVSGVEMLPVFLSHLSVSVLSFLVHDGWEAKLHSPHFQRVFPLLKSLDFSIPLDRFQLRTLAVLLPNLQHISALLQFEKFEDTDATDYERDEPASLQPILIH